jgi:hypothetical protein
LGHRAARAGVRDDKALLTAGLGIVRAIELGSDLGHITALVTAESGKKVLSYHVDMVDAGNKNYTDRLAAL